MPQPLEYSDAWDVHREATTAQRDAEDALAIVNRDAALAEEAYRKALAAEMWRLRQMDKDRPAWTVMRGVLVPRVWQETVDLRDWRRI